MNPDFVEAEMRHRFGRAPSDPEGPIERARRRPPDPARPNHVPSHIEVGTWVRATPEEREKLLRIRRRLLRLESQRGWLDIRIRAHRRALGWPEETPR